LILLVPREERFTWFSSLVMSDVSRSASYLAYKALNETEATIVNTETKLKLLVKRPNVITIDSKNPLFEVIMEFSLDMARNLRSDSLSKYDDPLEFEFNYNPDFLGMYLNNNVKYKGYMLEAGIYILVPKIIKYLRILNRYINYVMDPNVIIGTTFYHEYMHMILDLIGFHYNNACIKDLCIRDLEEVMCEGLSLITLPKDLNELIGDNFLGGDLYTGKIEGSKSINILNYEISIKFAHQLIDKVQFLRLPRIYPYRLVRNFFIDNEEIGWLLVREFLYTAIKKINDNSINGTVIQPKVFIVINDGKQSEYRISLGHKYEYREGLIY